MLHGETLASSQLAVERFIKNRSLPSELIAEPSRLRAMSYESRMPTADAGALDRAHLLPQVALRRDR